MGIFSAVKNFIFGKTEDDEPIEEEFEDEVEPPVERTGGGFKTKKRVVKKTGEELVPVLQDAHGEKGGIQGLRWFLRELQQDAHGDYAHEFWEESEQAGSALSIVPGVQQSAGRKKRWRLLDDGHIEVLSAVVK